jgi:hypothetical protein
MTDRDESDMSNERRPIILCAGQHGRAVLYGYVDSMPRKGDAVTLHDARMVLYWDAQCGGLLGLAAQGPKGATRITHAVPSTMSTVWTEWVAVPPEAAKELDAWPPA